VAALLATSIIRRSSAHAPLLSGRRIRRGVDRASLSHVDHPPFERP
jgi:hypothetical protein